MSQKLVERLQQEFSGDVTAVSNPQGDETIAVGKDKLVDVLTHLRDAEGCEQLSDVVGVDYPGRDQRFEVNYLVRSWKNNQRIIVKVAAGEDEPVPTVTGVYRSADWHEREAYDLVGICFTGHPNPKRILCPEDWVGHALRKDYEFPLEYHGIRAK